MNNIDRIFEANKARMRVLDAEMLESQHRINESYKKLARIELLIKVCFGALIVCVLLRLYLGAGG